jgi:hypothetical protein
MNQMKGSMSPNMMMDNTMGNMGMMSPNMMNMNMLNNPMSANNMGMMDPSMMNMNMINNPMNGNNMMNMMNMNNMNMMPNMFGMNGNMMMNQNMMNMGMPNMMGMPMGNMAAMGNMAGMGNLPGMDDSQGWNLIFENQNDLSNIIVTISEQKTIKEAISMYRLKANRTDECKFLFNSKQLYPEMRICESGLKDKSKILVVSIQNLKGARQ